MAMRLTFAKLCKLLDLNCLIDSSTHTIFSVSTNVFENSLSKMPDEHCVLIGSLKDYLRSDTQKIPHYICTTPLSGDHDIANAVRGEVSVLDFLSNSVPDGFSFACVKSERQPEELLEIIENELRTAKRLNYNALHLYECLSSDADIQSIVDTAGSLLNNPILVANNSFQVLAHTRNVVCSGELWRSVSEDHCFPSEYLKVADNEFYNVVYRQNDLSLLIDPPEWGTVYLSKCLTVNSQSVGFVSMLQSCHKFDSYDFELFKVLRNVLNIAAIQDKTLNRFHSSRYMYVLEDLLTDRFSDSDLNIRLAQADLTPLKYLNIIYVHFLEKRIYTPTYILSRLEAMIPFARGVVCEDNSIGLIVMRNRDDDPIIPNEKKLMPFLSECNMALGISMTYFGSEIGLTSQYYKQAKLAAYWSKKLKDNARLCYYQKYMYYHILEDVSTNDELNPFFHYKLREILDYDRECGTDYADTLFHYINQGYSALKASQVLGVHRNTLDYRLGRLKELFGIDMNDYDLMQALNISFSILHYRTTCESETNRA